MILLAADTSGKEGSLALVRAENGPNNGPFLEILDVVALEGGNFSAQLVPQMAALLSQRGIKLPEFPSPQFAHNLYFVIGVLVAVISMARIYLGTA